MWCFEWKLPHSPLAWARHTNTHTHTHDADLFIFIGHRRHVCVCNIVSRQNIAENVKIKILIKEAYSERSKIKPVYYVILARYNSMKNVETTFYCCISYTCTWTYIREDFVCASRYRKDNKHTHTYIVHTHTQSKSKRIGILDRWSKHLSDVVDNINSISSKLQWNESESADITFAMGVDD